MVGFNQEGVVLEHVAQQGAGGVHHAADAPPGEAGENALIYVNRKGGGNAARKDKGVAPGNAVQLHQQLLQSLRRNVRALTVDLGLQAGFQLDIDAAHAGGKHNKVALDRQLVQPGGNALTGESGQKAQRHGIHTQIAQDNGDVDTLSTAAQLFSAGAVERAHLQTVQIDGIVQSGVKGNGINHGFETSSIMVKER